MLVGYLEIKWRTWVMMPKVVNCMRCSWKNEKKKMRKERWHFRLIRWRYLVTLIAVVTAGVSHDYSDKMNLLVVRITLLSTHLSHRLLCLEISINHYFLDTNFGKSICEGSRLAHILCESTQLWVDWVNSVQVICYVLKIGSHRYLS